jgi:predicted phosphodiesterase
MAPRTEHVADQGGVAIATTGNDAHDPRPSRRAGLPYLALRLAALLLTAVSLVALLAPGTYRVPRGSVTFQIRPAFPGGQIVMPLGPAGVLALDSHRTPVDVSVDYRLPDEVPSLNEAEQLLRGLPEFQTTARIAFRSFAFGKGLWLLGLGAGVGLLAVGPRRRETILLAAGFGAVGALALGGAFALVTLATVDRTPEVRYAGLASNVPRLLPLLRGLETQGAGRLDRLSEYVEGLQLVALNLEREVEGTAAPDDVRRVLLFSDVHSNVYGMRYASRLARGGDQPVDLVLVAGDVTDSGAREEAELFVRLFTSAGAPVMMVGGNHEARPAMAVFAEAEIDALDWESASAAGLEVYGISDPVAFSPLVDSDEELLREQAERLAAAWPDMDPPDVLLVHDVRQAEEAIRLAEDAGQPLVVAFGNDHVLAVDRRGSVVLVDPGTAGASGYGAVGRGEEIPYSFQLLDFSLEEQGRLVAVTSVTYSANGRSRIDYEPVTE